MYEDGTRDPAFDAEPTYRELLAKVEELETEIERRKKNARASADVMTEARERIIELQRRAKLAAYMQTERDNAYARVEAVKTRNRKYKEQRDAARDERDRYEEQLKRTEQNVRHWYDRFVELENEHERVERNLVSTRAQRDLAEERAAELEKDLQTELAEVDKLRAEVERKSVVGVERELNRLNGLLNEAEADAEDLRGVVREVRRDRDELRNLLDNARAHIRDIAKEREDLRAEFDRYREYTQAGFNTLYHEREFGPASGAPRTENIISDKTYQTHKQFGGEWRRQVVYPAAPPEQTVGDLMREHDISSVGELLGRESMSGSAQVDAVGYESLYDKVERGEEVKPPRIQLGEFKTREEYEAAEQQAIRTIRKLIEDAVRKSKTMPVGSTGTSNIRFDGTIGPQQPEPERAFKFKRAPRHGKTQAVVNDLYAFPGGVYPEGVSYDFWGPAGRNDEPQHYEVRFDEAGRLPRPHWTYVQPKEDHLIPHVPEQTLAEVMGEIHNIGEWEREVKARRARRSLGAVFELVSDRWGEAMRRAAQQIGELAAKRLDEQRERIFYGGRTAAEIAQAARIRDQLTRHLRTHARPREELWAGINSPFNPEYEDEGFTLEIPPLEQWDRQGRDL